MSKTITNKTGMSVLLIVGPKCAGCIVCCPPPVSHAEYEPRVPLRLEKDYTDKRRTPDGVTLTARHGQRYYGPRPTIVASQSFGCMGLWFIFVLLTYRQGVKSRCERVCNSGRSVVPARASSKSTTHIA